MNDQEIIWNISSSLPSVYQEEFFEQHFVGKSFIYDPSAPKHHATFSDGTVVYAVSSDGTTYDDEALATSLTEQIAAHRKAIATYVPYY